MAANAAASAEVKEQAFERRKAARRPLPEHLAIEREINGLAPHERPQRAQGNFEAHKWGGFNARA